MGYDEYALEIGGREMIAEKSWACNAQHTAHYMPNLRCRRLLMGDFLASRKQAASVFDEAFEFRIIFERVDIGIAVDQR